MPPDVAGLEWVPTPSDLPFVSAETTKACEEWIKDGPHGSSVFDFKGGNLTPARVKYYLWDSDLLAACFETPKRHARR